MKVHSSRKMRIVFGLLVTLMMTIIFYPIKVTSFCLTIQTPSLSTTEHLYLRQRGNNSYEKRRNPSFLLMSPTSSDNAHNEDITNKTIDPNTLMDMDIIIYTMKDDEKQQAYLGAIQEDSTLAPLSAWTTEPAFGSSIEFVVDEEDRWKKELELDNIIVKSLLSEGLFSYGSRQVGGGKGLGNPHGEESELIYYIENEILEEENVHIPIKPELEILW